MLWREFCQGINRVKVEVREVKMRSREQEKMFKLITDLKAKIGKQWLTIPSRVCLPEVLRRLILQFWIPSYNEQ